MICDELVAKLVKTLSSKLWIRCLVRCLIWLAANSRLARCLIWLVANTRVARRLIWAQMPLVSTRNMLGKTRKNAHLKTANGCSPKNTQGCPAEHSRAHPEIPVRKPYKLYFTPTSKETPRRYCWYKKVSSLKICENVRLGFKRFFTLNCTVKCLPRLFSALRLSVENDRS
jgi:hypothetical protein